MKSIEPLIPRALVATRRFLLAPGAPNTVQKEYDGYAASLGAVIRTSGLIPALAFYTDCQKLSEKNKNEPRRFKLLQALAYVLGEDVQTEHQRFLLELVLRDVFGANVFTLAVSEEGFRVNPDHGKLKKWKEKIIDASIALKLAMRNFPHSEK